MFELDTLVMDSFCQILMYELAILLRCDLKAWLFCKTINSFHKTGHKRVQQTNHNILLTNVSNKRYIKLGSEPSSSGGKISNQTSTSQTEHLIAWLICLGSGGGWTSNLSYPCIFSIVYSESYMKGNKTQSTGFSMHDSWMGGIPCSTKSQQWGGFGGGGAGCRGGGGGGGYIGKFNFSTLKLLFLKF